jgi:hypothetical protein
MSTVLDITFYVSNDGIPLTSAASQMEFESLRNLDGTERKTSAPAITEIGSGWYKFTATLGTAPFDAGDLVGVIDADKNGTNGLADIERYIPVEVGLDVAVTEPSGDPANWTFAQKLLWLVMRFSNSHSSDNFNGIRVRKSDDTIATTQTVTEAAGVKTVSKVT